ncbi:MAG TPA: response regulator, partial [Fibrobacteria bacterium]|nr:response regulator [Fibrobacteria bacterium]
VEDEDPVRRLVAGILAGEGYRVVEAANGPAALQAFTAGGQAVDLVLSDILMPGMSGRELVQALKSLRPDLKVIFMSGYIDDEAFAVGLGSGSAPFLAKPFSPTNLIAKVREVLESELARTPNGIG